VIALVPTAGGGGAPSARSRCSEARSRAVQLDAADPEGHIFIPVCEERGGGGALYAAAQCHAATGYCWCVDRQTGVPIPGLATRNVTPNCTQLDTDTFRGTTRSPTYRSRAHSVLCVFAVLAVCLSPAVSALFLWVFNLN